ncbi:MAG TPA: phosphoribosylformylglycinamidine synthase subunit PurS [Gemmatimonadaceae bacterium]|nr:phosphoribosylformylglycinamidine synthase subunit PurS [Gemmatimonadaceae bacterium]
MSRFRVSIHIVPRKGILDPQGKTVADALHTLGFRDVADARIGRHIVLDVAAADAAAAGAAVREMCDRLLANPVTEDYEIAGVEGL